MAKGIMLKQNYKQADPNEPNFQQAFWDANYPRLLSIKRAVDPWDVLWCTPCVGNERWHEVGDLLKGSL
jgi:hypothetical protein